jgi:hypothetical protein
MYDRIAALTLEINEKSSEIRAYYKSEPRFHIPPTWDLREQWRPPALRRIRTHVLHSLMVYDFGGEVSW